MHKKLLALNAQWNLRNNFTHKSFKHLKSKKFQTFLFPTINCRLFCSMVKRFCLTKLYHCWSMSKPHSSPWFSAPCAGAIVYLSLKQSSDSLVIVVKVFLELPNLHMQMGELQKNGHKGFDMENAFELQFQSAKS